jgi:hypothetical protein
MLSMKHSTKLYRGGAPSAKYRGMTAWDIVRYEREELGNDIHIMVSIDTLKNIPSDKVEWVTVTLEQAAEYGEPYEISEDVEYMALAKDNYGGLLVYIYGGRA